MDIKLKGFAIGFVLGASILFLFMAGIVLWSIGPFTPLHNANKATGFSGGKIGAIDASIKCTTTDLSVVLINQAGTTLSNITVAQSNIGYDGAVTGVGAAGNLPPNKAATLTMPVGSPGDVVIGDGITTDISITYDERVAGTVITKKQSGRIFCTVE